MIGLIGRKGSGKSEVARYLTREYMFSRRPFAFYLKAMLSALGVPVDILDGNDDAKNQPLDCLHGRTTRWAMQTLGTEWGRTYMGQDFWVNLWKAGCPNYNRIVVDDVRFPNEADAVIDMGGYLIKIERELDNRLNDTHVSEAIDDLPFDMKIVNAGTLDDLRRDVDDIIYMIGEECRN